MRRGFARAALAIALIVALAIAGRLLLMPSAAPPTEQTARIAKAPAPTPTLYCEFYNFMRNATVVSFLFAVEQAAGGDPRFLEMAVVEPDQTRTEFEADQRPQWTRGTDEDGKQTIASPDGATRIVLYGFKPKQPGIFWTEAGVRSDTYKNLEGKCRQANF